MLKPKHLSFKMTPLINDFRYSNISGESTPPISFCVRRKFLQNTIGGKDDWKNMAWLDYT